MYLGLELWNAIDDSIWDQRFECSNRFIEHDRWFGSGLSGNYAALFYAHVVTNVHKPYKNLIPECSTIDVL